MKQQQSITSLPASPDEERHQRMIKYSLAMGVRMVCIILVFFVEGWWQLIMIIGALVLPYIAVVLANVRSTTQADVERPISRVPARIEPHTSDEE